MRVDKQIRTRNEYLGSAISRTFLSIWGLLVARDRTGALDYDDLSIGIGEKQYALDAFPRGGLRIPGKRNIRIGFYKVRLPLGDLEALPTQTGLRLIYSGPEDAWFDVPLAYAGLSQLRLHRHGRLFPLHDGASRAVVRQTGSGRMYLTLRETNVTDSLGSTVKIFAARLAALIPSKEKVLLYEKKSSRYEESASVVFESLVDSGRDDVFFILDPAKLDDVPEKYRSRIIPRFSFKHFYYFFTARTLIGTELAVHAAELRTINRLLLSRLRSPKLRFVFLQHGVMYMVALSSKQRGFFRAGAGFPKHAKIVCSSELEKRHFVEQAGFRPEDLYVCGLPKFDHAALAPGADRILIMPTWRPWEYNAVRTDAERSGYVVMLRQMYDAVPEHLKDRVWILPHPLVREALESSPLGEHLWAGDSYDSALRRGTLLITDYSSIAYDAFYRGASVVFWWKDKDDCMDRYGGHLMLTEQTAFGPVSYDGDALGKAIIACYEEPQDPEYVQRYEQIVEFHDGRNTERLIDMMERDGLV